MENRDIFSVGFFACSDLSRQVHGVERPLGSTECAQPLCFRALSRWSSQSGGGTEVFQPMIVPQLVCDFGERYGADLNENFQNGVEAVRRNRTVH